MYVVTIRFLTSSSRSGTRVAYPRLVLFDGRVLGVVLQHHVEMGVEGGDLVDLRQRHSHGVGKRRQMRVRQAAVAILDQVQMLDQQVASTRDRKSTRLKYSH